ncbi:hypothetical protein RRG08_060906 [Elysia crispata]|uniref:Uncharacterized protein n=1 Tax=Elysia crispata TaxID=231223 RepID=A0AAE0Z391_9GAST|nr:hypothetical protein RRG08_060906 [Elysia crispata]
MVNSCFRRYFMCLAALICACSVLCKIFIPLCSDIFPRHCNQCYHQEDEPQSKHRPPLPRALDLVLQVDIHNSKSNTFIRQRLEEKCLCQDQLCTNKIEP